jgi:predicted PurR-regulated permease PerM
MNDPTSPPVTSSPARPAPLAAPETAPLPAADSGSPSATPQVVAVFNPPVNNNETIEASPRWGSNVKLIVGLTVVALLVALMIYFRTIIGPLLLAFILAFLIQPLAASLSRRMGISWRLSVNLLYLVLLVVVIGLITVAGLAILQQAQSAITYINNFVNTLPETIAGLSRQSYGIGPFKFDFSSLDLPAAAQQALDLVRPLLGEAGTLIGTVASGTVNTLGWGLFVLLISYFLLSESGQLREDLVHIEVPGYTADFQRLVRELVSTWYAFLRGQMVIALLIVVAYYILLSILGMRLPLAIALLAGVAAFIPYIGPAVLWVVIGIISYLQVDNYLGLSPVTYSIVVIVCSLSLNQVFDYMITPRILGNTLGVHPAGVLIAAIIATDLIGFVGLILAAPVLATVMLVGRYITAKMLDQNPWAKPPRRTQGPTPHWMRLDKRLQALWRWFQSRYR